MNLANKSPSVSASSNKAIAKTIQAQFFQFRFCFSGIFDIFILFAPILAGERKIFLRSYSFHPLLDKCYVVIIKVHVVLELVSSSIFGVLCAYMIAFLFRYWLWLVRLSAVSDSPIVTYYNIACQ